MNPIFHFLPRAASFRIFFVGSQACLEQTFFFFCQGIAFIQPVITVWFCQFETYFLALSGCELGQFGDNLSFTHGD